MTQAKADVAVVTGGTGAIGAAIAAALQSRGLHVVAADLDAKPVAAGQSFFACDVTDPASLKALFAHAETLGTLRCVIAAHGILMETPAGAADPAAVAKVLDINLNGVAYLCDLAGSHLGRDTSVLLISSVTAFMGRAKNAYAYQASKAGVESLTRTFAVAYGPKGIRVNCIAPGFMAVPMKGAGTELRQRQGGSDTVGKAAPLGQVIAPQEIAHAAAFLCSKDAAAITGVVLPVDGGFGAL
ncbi:SDR family oxidoreductase [Methylocella sp. CPCC 101449]|uniref:SDR family oxidoreductase n=1 Tax=Methylocella sp. CPCC 101449 TaxID=2987531 RepID=UPI00288D26CA|nr:SDR family oxidoreductase [Methylocella sp. CPCC 101449]MDT2020294.1 SDR family oxidoreductase [Methylocella sp. CPCC 101449]